MSEIRKPADWENSSMEDLLSCEAGRAYVLDQLDSSSKAIQPEHVFESSHNNCDSAWYEIYSDGSLWFVNNAEDEVWADYTDFVQQSLLPGIAASAAQKGMCWDEEEAAESDDFTATNQHHQPPPTTTTTITPAAALAHHQKFTYSNVIDDDDDDDDNHNHHHHEHQHSSASSASF